VENAYVMHAVTLSIFPGPATDDPIAASSCPAPPEPRRVNCGYESPRADVFDYIERFHNPRKTRKIEQLEKEEASLIQPSVRKG
jgi:hypothetical protein